MSVDRFRNPHTPNLPYARGEILRSTEDDFQKLQRAWSLIRERGPGSTYVLTGPEHSLPLAAEELEFADDEIAPALSFERLKELALDHLGGSPESDDVAVFNRLTGATMATHLTLVKPGDVVIGVSATHSHPAIPRAAGHVGARFIDTAGLGAFREAIATEHSVALVVLTRLAVTYDLLPLEAIETIVRLAHDKGALVYIDDAGGRTGGSCRVRSAANARARCRYRRDRSRQIRHEGATVRPARRQERSGRSDPGQGLRVRHGSPPDALPGGGADPRTIRPGAGSGCSSRRQSRSPASFVRCSAIGSTRHQPRCRLLPTTSSRSRWSEVVCTNRPWSPTKPRPRYRCCSSGISAC